VSNFISSTLPNLHVRDSVLISMPCEILVCMSFNFYATPCWAKATVDSARKALQRVAATLVTAVAATTTVPFARTQRSSAEEKSSHSHTLLADIIDVQQPTCEWELLERFSR